MFFNIFFINYNLIYFLYKILFSLYIKLLLDESNNYILYLNIKLFLYIITIRFIEYLLKIKLKKII